MILKATHNFQMTIDFGCKSASINMEHSNCFHYLNSNDGQVHLMRFRLMGSLEAEGTG